MVKIVLSVLFLITVTYADKKTVFDGSSTEKCQNSYTEISNGLSEEENLKLTGVMANQINFASTISEDPYLTVCKDFHNLNFEQIIEKYTINGAFGIKFGEKIDFNMTKTTEGVPTANFFELFEINPPKKLKYFDTYLVYTTPKSKKVTVVGATNSSYTSLNECKMNLDKIKPILKKKYFSVNVIKDDSYEYNFMDSFLPVKVVVQCDQQNLSQARLTLMYIDYSLDKIAKQERHELDLELENGLGDAL